MVDQYLLGSLLASILVIMVLYNLDAKRNGRAESTTAITTTTTTAINSECRSKNGGGHEDVDVIIVGAGVAGVALAHTLGKTNMKLGYMTGEAYKNNRRAVRVAEQLEAVQAASCETEAELRRLKVQSDQWRKAAEATAAKLSTGNNGKFMERTGSLDSSYNPATGKIGSPDSNDVVDDFMKKKNGNVLRKIGVDECDEDLHPATEGSVELTLPISSV